MNFRVKHFAFALALTSLAACGPTSNTNTSTNSLSAKEEAMLDEDVSAPLGLQGLGDRFCRLNFSFVKKDAGGNFSVVGSGTTTDGVARTGFGVGCVQFCAKALNELISVNEKNGISVLMKGCQFAEPAAAAAAAPAAPMPTPEAAKGAAAAPAAAQAAAQAAAKMDACKIVQADQVVIFAEQRSRAECASECSAKEQSNPGRRCEWGSEVLRQHPVNQCIIRGQAGKLHYQQTVTRFQCRMECAAREQTNPFRSCLWGGEDIKGK